MPSVTVHVHLARRVLEALERRPRIAPFDASRPELVNAFLQGSFGPDLGYMPGGHRPLSDLAHCLYSGDLTRALLERSQTPEARAFSWGWVTHVLADVFIHPIVGCAVGELVYGSPSHFADGDKHPVAHVRVEAGLDAIYAERHPELRRLRFDPALTASEIDVLVDAFDMTYGVTPDRTHFTRSHRVAGRRAEQGLRLAHFTARLLPTHVKPLRAWLDRQLGPVSWLRSKLGSRHVALGYVLPVLPPLWFLDAVRDVEENFVEFFEEQVACSAQSLSNANLDTGRPDREDLAHGGLRRSLDLLTDLGGRVPAWASPPTPLAGAA